MNRSSKTLRMSRSSERRNADNDMARRGRASNSRAALLEPDVVLTGRRFRRANRLTHAEAALFEAVLRRPAGDPADPRFTVTLDDHVHMVTAPRL